MNPAARSRALRCGLVVALVVAGTPTVAGARAFHPRARIQGAGPGRHFRMPHDAKLDAQVRRLVSPEPAAALRTSQMAPIVGRWQWGDTLHVHVQLAPGARAADLDGHGLSVERTTDGIVEGWLRTADVAALAELPAVRALRPVRPGRLRATADVAARADLARATGFDGTGVTIGVISDGPGSLPSSAVPAGCTAGSGSEGQALIQVAQTLAPGATLRFSSGLSGSQAFIDSIACLKAAGARVIVDDLGFYDEPFFADGPIAQAVRAAVQAGVSFHSAAGNDADGHYAAQFKPTAGSAYHDFATSGDVDNYDELDVPPSGELDCVLQWNDQFGAAADDYDLEVYDLDASPPELITSSTNLQDGTQDPYEDFVIFNFGRTEGRAGVAIKKNHGANRALALFCFGADSSQYLTPAGSIIGHPAVTEVVAVGAMDVADPGLDTIETYSSQGPSRIDFPVPESRPKPDLVAFDGVDSTVPGFRPFFGTSAAAPDSAAVAALLISKRPCLTPAQVQHALTSTAVDVGAAGVDPIYGAGRIDALAAIQSLPDGSCTGPGDCDDGDACTIDACDGCLCVHRPGCDDENPCTTDSCEVDGCHHDPVTDGTSCADTTVCNGDETCQSGVCTPGPAPVCTADDACSTAGCDPTSGCTSTPLEGFAGVACVCAQALATPACENPRPTVLLGRFGRACRLVARAANAKDTRREHVLVRRALGAFSRAARRAALVVRRGGLSTGCGDALTSAIDDARSRAERLGTGLVSSPPAP